MFWFLFVWFNTLLSRVMVAQYLYEMKKLNLKLDTHIIIPIKIICIFCSKFMFSATHKVRSKTVSLVIYCFSYFYHQINFRSALICILFKINKWDKDKWLMDFFIHNVRLYYSFFSVCNTFFLIQACWNIQAYIDNWNMFDPSSFGT